LLRKSSCSSKTIARSAMSEFSITPSSEVVACDSSRVDCVAAPDKTRRGPAPAVQALRNWQNEPNLSLNERINNYSSCDWMPCLCAARDCEDRSLSDRQKSTYLSIDARNLATGEPYVTVHITEL